MNKVEQFVYQFLASPMKIDTYSEFPGDLTLSTAALLGQPAPLKMTPLVAQQFEDTLFERSGNILDNFVESGQVWALLGGVVIGYVIRGITTY